AAPSPFVSYRGGHLDDAGRPAHPPSETPRYAGLQPTERRIESRGADQPREVAQRHTIWIHDHQATDAQVDELLDHVRPEAAGAYDPNNEFRQGILALAPEEAELAIESLIMAHESRRDRP